MTVEATEITQEIEKILQTGDPSPGYGIYVPEDVYRDYRKAIKAREHYEKVLKERKTESHWLDKIFFFVGGVMIGAATGTLIF